MRRHKVCLTNLVAIVAGALAPATVAAQGTASITGTVLDSLSRRPIPAVQIVVTGTTRGAVTNESGQYAIRGLPAGELSVRVQRIGYAPVTRVVTIGEGQTMEQNFTLAEVARTLSEVVVVGYGTNTRAGVSNSVATVSAEEIANTPVAGVDAALQGKAAGVQVVQNAGNPGVGISVRVRGSSSLSASNQPLYVVDGIPLVREDYSQLDVGGQNITGVTGLNPDEIESITVLKDAAASAIYGSRGSNGVILISTRRGRAGASRLTINAYTGIQDVPKKWDLLTGTEYVTYMNEAAANDGYGPEFFGSPADAARTQTDWQDAIFRKAPVSDLTVGASGGSDRVQYYLSGGYFDQTGVALGSSYNRASGRVNLDFAGSSRFAVKSSMSFSREKHGRIENDNTIDGVVTNAIAVEPNRPVRQPDGTFTSPRTGLSYSNPVALGELNSIESRSLRAIGNIEAVYNLTSALRMNGRFGIDMMNLRDLRWDSPEVLGTRAAGVSGIATHGNVNVNRYVVEGFANWDAPFGSAHQLGLTAGASAEWNGAESELMVGEGFGSEVFRYVGNAARVSDYAGGWTGNNLASFFARANYSLANRYIFTGSIRADGSSRFGENNRFGTFPAASVAWTITDEPWLGDMLGATTGLKFRVSYGITGNQSIPQDFASRERFGGGARYAETVGLAQVSFPNPDLKWEQTAEFDAGFDLFLLDGRFAVIGDFYNKLTKDLLVQRPITATTGQTAIFQNVGNLQNRGYELTLSSKNIVPASARGFRWDTDFNIAANRNKVTRLYNNEPFTAGIRGVNRVEVGQPLGAYYTWEFIGVDPQTGDAKYRDLDGNGRINAADRLIVGSPHPDYQGGLTNEFSWGGLDLRAFVQFSQGAEIYNAIRIFADDGGYYTDNKFGNVMNRWQKPGDVTREPRASFDGLSGARRVSSRYIENGSYVRIQDVTLGYRLPERWGGAIRMQDARVYVSGRNLRTFTDYSGYSPDVNSGGSNANLFLGTDFYAYPIPRSVTFGISGSW